MSKSARAIFLSILALVVLSVWALYSALMFKARGPSMMLTQFVAIGVGFVGFSITMLIDYRRLNDLRWILPLYLLALVMLGLVLHPRLSPPVNGAQRWLFGFQPSELGKVALLFALAWYCTRFKHRLHSFGYSVLGVGAVVLPVLGLIFVEPDRGTTLFLAGLCVVLLLVAGVRWYQLGAAALVAVLVVGPILAADPLVRRRFGAFLNPDEHKGAAAHQNRQALLAFGEGGLTGKGPGAGTMMRTIPEAHTDFILPVIGEELGLAGASGVVVAYLMILVCGASIAQRAARAGDTFGLMLAAGITLLVSFQAYFNIGIVTGVLPNKGLPLPFVSRGGSNMVVLLTLMGVLFSVDRHLPTGELATGTNLCRRRKRRNPFETGELTEGGATGEKAGAGGDL